MFSFTFHSSGSHKLGSLTTSTFAVLQGDINEKQNKNTEMEKLIDEMTFKLGGASVEHEDKLAALQEEAQTIRANIEVGHSTSDYGGVRLAELFDHRFILRSLR